MEASVLVPAPNVPFVPTRLTDTRCLRTWAASMDEPKSKVALARIQALLPVSATIKAPSLVDGPAVKATAPAIAPVPNALVAPPRKTSTRWMSSMSKGKSIKWWPVCGALHRTPSTHKAVCSKVPPRTLRSVWMPKGPRCLTSSPGTDSRTSPKEAAPVWATSSGPRTTSARGADSGETVEKGPVTAATGMAVVSFAKSFWARA